MDLWSQNSPTRHVSPSYNFGDDISIRETSKVWLWARYGPGRSSYALLQQRQTTPAFGQWVTHSTVPRSPPFFLNYGLAAPFAPFQLSFDHHSADRRSSNYVCFYVSLTALKQVDLEKLIAVDKWGL